jgi:hypothetical protein
MPHFRLDDLGLWWVIMDSEKIRKLLLSFVITDFSRG